MLFFACCSFETLGRERDKTDTGGISDIRDGKQNPHYDEIQHVKVQIELRHQSDVLDLEKPCEQISFQDNCIHGVA